LLANLLVAIGRATFGDPADIAGILVELETALSAADKHIAHEDRYVRPALAQRAPNAITVLDSEHAEHAVQVAELRAIATSLKAAETSGARTALGETLYLHFSVFVAETLAHMAFEERVVQPLLDRLFDRAELEAIHAAIVTSIPPTEMFEWLQAMIPSANREHRRELMDRVKSNAPPEVVKSLLDALRPRLPAQDWADLGGTVSA
jgi:hypothetical protein